MQRDLIKVECGGTTLQKAQGSHFEIKKVKVFKATDLDTIDLFFAVALGFFASKKI